MADLTPAEREAMALGFLSMPNGPKPVVYYQAGFEAGLAYARECQDGAVLDAEEQEVMDHILAAMKGILAFGLETNKAEWIHAIHTLQSFVILHMLQRLEPGSWGSWYVGADLGMTDDH